MNRKIGFFSVFIISFILCGSGAWAMNHEKTYDTGHNQHSGMMMGESMVILGQAEVSGIKGMAHLSDVRKQMTAMGRSETNHFMMMFSDTKTGQPIDTGTAALKVQTPAGETLAPVKLIGMDGHFGADITLKETGEYHFLVGTKLGDGQKRQFHFDYTLK